MFSEYPLPKYIEIETSRYCNRRCAWCPNGKHRHRTIQTLMEWELFESIITNLSVLEFDGIIALHNYNEPLRNPRLIDELKLILLNLPMSEPSIFTNGDYLDQNTFRDLQIVGVKYLRVTLYPSSINDADPSDKRIQSWLKARQFDERYFEFRSVRQGRGAHSKFEEMRLEIISPDLRNYNYRGGTAVSMNEYQRLLPCYMTSHSAAIDYQGRFKMCCNVFPENVSHEKYVIGSLREKTFQEIWNSYSMNRLRDAHRIGDWEGSEICAKCSHFLPEDRIKLFS